MDVKKEEPSLQDVAKFLLGEGELKGCWFGEKPDAERGNYWWRTYLRAALAQPAQGEVKFLLDGTRLKLSFQEVECDHCGETVHGSLVAVPLDQYADELNGRWVALVPAENDQHLSQPPADTIAVPRSEWKPIETAPDDAEFLAYRRGIISQCGWKQTEHGDEVIGGLGWNYPESDLPTHWMPLPKAPAKSTGEDV